MRKYEKNGKKIVDEEFANDILPASERKSGITMLMIMLGFTFFSGSMWAGQKLAEGVNFEGFVSAVLIGGIILSVYTGLLAWISASSGMGVDLLARKALGSKGSYIVSIVISITQIGWFGVGIAMFAIPVATEIFGESIIAQWVLVVIAGLCMIASAYFGIKSLTIVSYIAVPVVAILGTIAMYLAISRGDNSLSQQFSLNDKTLGIGAGTSLVVGSFISGGTTTPNFARYAKTGKAALITTTIAFFLGNSLMIAFGGVSSIYVGGNDIFNVMLKLDMFYLALLVLGLNIWTTNDNALYSAGLGLANIFKKEKKHMILISGVFGTLTSIWLYWNFCNWLNVLNCALPPCGAILIASYFMNKKDYLNTEVTIVVDWYGVAGIIAGAFVANMIKSGICAINSMVIALAFYFWGYIARKYKKKI